MEVEKEIINEFMTAEDVAKKIGMSKRFVQKITANGEIKAYRFGSKIKYKLKDVEMWIEEQKQDAV